MAGSGQKQSGKSKKGRQHAKHNGKYARQVFRTAKNKEKAWAKHLKNHPNDKQNKEAIKKAKEG